jgi:hypothetical protein
MNLARYAWDEPSKPTARREKSELCMSRIIAREDKRKRQAERRALWKARLLPFGIGLALLGCFVAGLWGTSP